MSENLQMRCLWCHHIQEGRWRDIQEREEACDNCGRDMLKLRDKYTVGEFGSQAVWGPNLLNGYAVARDWAKLAREKAKATVIPVADTVTGGAYCYCPTEEDYNKVMTWYNSSHRD